MIIPVGHVIRLRSTEAARQFADGLSPIETSRRGREITFLESAEILPVRRRKSAHPARE